MLEIIGIWFVAGRIGKIVEQKGRPSGWYKVSAVFLWIVGEMLGIVVGVILTEADESARCISYLFGFAGAALFSGILYLIASRLPKKENETPGRV
jgi:hypothetical protein